MYFIIPTNEGQELNYVHTFRGLTLKEAKSFGCLMRDRLKPIFTQGSIGCLIQDRTGKELAFLQTTGTKWEGR